MNAIGLHACSLAFLVLSAAPAWAVHCEGASHMTCKEGVDESGRSPGGLYDAAVEALNEARTPAERALAQRAMKDAFDPRLSDPRAVACNRNPGPDRNFAACVAGAGPAPGLHMTVACQQKLDDGRVLVDGGLLPAGATYRIARYQPASKEMGWSHGTCDLEITRR